MTGFINVNKACGVSSAREVAIIKKFTGMPCGHMGTLDPMASGVLPIAVGNASRLFDYMLDKRKKYVAEFRFGVDSDTLDITGCVTENAGFVPEYAQIKDVLGKFVGDIFQVPPKYSAKNIAGRRGYELAREGVEFELEPKLVKIYSIDILGQDGDVFQFEIECGGGTYIRSLARDIAKRLGTCAVMSALQRVSSGVFTVDNSVCTHSLNKENIESYIIPTDSILPFESIFPNDSESFKLFNGLPVPSLKADGVYKIYKNGSFYGLAEVKQSLLKVRTKLC